MDGVFRYVIRTCCEKRDQYLSLEWSQDIIAIRNSSPRNFHDRYHISSPPTSHKILKHTKDKRNDRQQSIPTTIMSPILLPRDNNNTINTMATTEAALLSMKKRQTVVTFKNKVLVKRISHCKSFSKTRISRVWYSSEELEEMFEKYHSQRHDDDDSDFEEVQEKYGNKFQDIPLSPVRRRGRYSMATKNSRRSTSLRQLGSNSLKRYLLKKITQQQSTNLSNICWCRNQ